MDAEQLYIKNFVYSMSFCENTKNPNCQLGQVSATRFH